MLFKYMPSQYVKAFFNDGSLKIGTLREYRNEEKYGVVIGDQDEGKKTLHTHIGKRVAWTANTMPKYMEQFIKIEKGASVSIGSSTFVSPIESPNAYVFCVTKSFSRSVMAEFGANACIEIHNKEKFFQAISRTIEDRAKFAGAASCIYTSRFRTHAEDGGIEPALIKDPKYKSQQEVRAIWNPLSAPIEPLYIKCPDAREFCRIHFLAA